MKQKIISIISKLTNLSDDEIKNQIEIPPSPELGDYTFPCFALSKFLKKSPNEIASDLAKKIKSSDLEKIEAKGPYINFFINSSALAKETLNSISKQKEKYGSHKAKKDKIMLEFSQANTHKAFHIGHIRGTSIGESLSRIIEFTGNKVIRANYQGDTGMHVAKWLWCYLKYHKKEELKSESQIASIYIEAVKKLAEEPSFQEEVNEINRKLENKSDKSLIDLWKKTRKASLNAFEEIYKDLNTQFNKYYFEGELEKEGKEISKELLKKNIAIISDEATIIDLEKYALGIWVLLRSDGTVLYSAKDLALAKKKFKEYKLEKSIYVIGAAQSLHMSQLLKTLELMKFPHRKKIKFISFAEVRLPTGKMSSRTGENILYSDFKKEITEYAKEELIKRNSELDKKELEKRALIISIAALKYAMLKQDNNKNIVFNKQEALNFEGNTGPYLLYSYARAKSILRKAKYSLKSDYKIENISKIEKNLIFQLSNFPEAVLQSYKALAPSIIANYAYHLSQSFNEFYHAEKVISSEKEEFRLSLVNAFSQVLRNSLHLLGISLLEEM